MGIVIDEATYLNVNQLWMDIREFFYRHYPDGEKRLVELYDEFMKRKK